MLWRTMRLINLSLIQCRFDRRRNQSLNVSRGAKPVEIAIWRRQDDFEIAVALAQLVRIEAMIEHRGTDPL